MKTRQTLATSIAVLLAGAFTTAQAQDVWSAGSALNFNWSDPLNWLDGSEPGVLDNVLLPTPIPNPAALLDPNKLTLSTGELANSLDIRDAYVLSGGNLTLSSGSIAVAPAIVAEINSSLLGAALTRPTMAPSS